MRNGDWESWRNIRIQLDEAYKEEEEYWARQFRVDWLQQGDKNTKYFQAVTGERRRKNRVERLITQGGDECVGDQREAKEISEYFQNQFKTSNLCDGNDILGGL